MFDLGAAGALKTLDCNVLERGFVVVYSRNALRVLVHPLWQQVEDRLSCARGIAKILLELLVGPLLEVRVQ